MNKRLLTEIAKTWYEEPDARSYFNWETIQEKDKAYCIRKSKLILSKIREVVEGAGLTEKEIWEAAGVPEYLWRAFNAKPKELRAVANAQTNAILKAIGGSND